MTWTDVQNIAITIVIFALLGSFFIAGLIGYIFIARWAWSLVS